MSDRWGTFDTNIGQTASEQIQARTDARTNEIRRAGVKINVMSDEEWNRRQKEATAKAVEWMRKRNEKLREQRLSKEKALQPREERIEREIKYPSLIKEKLQLYHEPADESTVSPDEWEAVYEQTSPFLAKCVIAYRYGLDKDNGRLAGPDLDYFGGKTLTEYLQWREIPVNGEEAGLNNLVSAKLVFPKFLSDALIDNLDAVSEDDSQVARKELLKFILEDEVVQIEITELVLEV